VLDLEADTYDELLNALDGIGVKLATERREHGAEVTSGGWASGWHFEITRNDGQTGDRYRRELTEWCDRRREERRLARSADGRTPQ
jgi:hypothetical protein